MTEIEKRIKSDIKNNKNKVKIFWDMDGTFSSMEMHLLEHKAEPGFFNNKRPIKTMLNIVKRLHKLGAQTYIISFCSYNYQKEDKLNWINRNCNFISADNAIIIPKKESDVKNADSKQHLKAEYLKDYVTDSDIVYMVDDNESVLLGTKEILPFINIVSPIDFIK